MLKGRGKLDGMEFNRRERWMVDGRAKAARTRGRVLVKERLQHRWRFLDARTWVPRPCSLAKLSSEKGRYSAEGSACTSVKGCQRALSSAGRNCQGRGLRRRVEHAGEEEGEGPWRKLQKVPHGLIDAHKEVGIQRIIAFSTRKRSTSWKGGESQMGLVGSCKRSVQEHRDSPAGWRRQVED